MDLSDKSLGFCAYWHYSVAMAVEWKDEQRVSNWENSTNQTWRDAWEAAANGAIAENEKRVPKRDEPAQKIDFIKINAQFSGRW